MKQPLTGLEQLPMEQPKQTWTVVGDLMVVGAFAVVAALAVVGASCRQAGGQWRWHFLRLGWSS